MAEIKIEKKKPIWPWILVLLALAAIAWYVFIREDGQDNEADGTRTEEISNTRPADNGTAE